MMFLKKENAFTKSAHKFEQHSPLSNDGVKKSNEKL